MKESLICFFADPPSCEAGGCRVRCRRRAWVVAGRWPRRTLSEIRSNNQVVSFTFIFPCKYYAKIVRLFDKKHGWNRFTTLDISAFDQWMKLRLFTALFRNPFNLGATSQEEDCPVEGLQEWLNDLRAKLGRVFGGSTPIWSWVSKCDTLAATVKFPHDNLPTHFFAKWGSQVCNWTVGIFST